MHFVRWVLVVGQHRLAPAELVVEVVLDVAVLGGVSQGVGHCLLGLRRDLVVGEPLESLGG